MRVPRTRGLTEASIRYRHSNNKEEQQARQEDLYRLLLDRYIADGFRLNGEPVDIHYLSELTGLSLSTIMRAITKNHQRLANLMTEEDTLDTSRALLAAIIGNSWADRGRIMGQVELLERAQAGQYVPFVSATLNQALKLLLETNKPILEVAKLLRPAGTGVTINNTNSQEEHNHEHLTVNQAVNLLGTKGGPGLLEDEGAKAGLKEAHGINLKELPEVVATRQQGIGIEQDTITLKGKVPKHDTRREEEGEIDSL